MRPRDPSSKKSIREISDEGACDPSACSSASKLSRGFESPLVFQSNSTGGMDPFFSLSSGLASMVWVSSLMDIPSPVLVSTREGVLFDLEGGGESGEGEIEVEAIAAMDGGRGGGGAKDSGGTDDVTGQDGVELASTTSRADMAGGGDPLLGSNIEVPRLDAKMGTCFFWNEMIFRVSTPIDQNT